MRRRGGEQERGVRGRKWSLMWPVKPTTLQQPLRYPSHPSFLQKIYLCSLSIPPISCEGSAEGRADKRTAAEALASRVWCYLGGFSPHPFTFRFQDGALAQGWQDGPSTQPLENLHQRAQLNISSLYTPIPPPPTLLLFSEPVNQEGLLWRKHAPHRMMPNTGWCLQVIKEGETTFMINKSLCEGKC